MTQTNGKRLTFLLVGWLFVCGHLMEVSAQGAAGWGMFRQNAAHTGRSPLAGPVFPDVTWRYNTGGYTYSSPAVAGNRIYVASENELVALDLDGDEVWTFTFLSLTTPPTIAIEGLVSSPAVGDDGTVYVGSLDNRLYAIDAVGSVRWSFDTGDQIFSSPVIGPDGTVYVGSRSQFVYALDSSGALRWSAFAGDEVLSSPALGPNGVLYVGSADGRLYAFDAATGAPAGTPFDVGSAIVSSPAVQNGVVVFGTVDNRVYAVDAATGQPRWATPFEAGGEIVSSPAFAAGGDVYVGSFDGYLYAIDGATGAEKWRWRPPKGAGIPIAASPAVDATGTIYIPSLDGRLYVLFDAGGQAIELWNFPAGGPIWASPAIGAQNRVYVAASGTRTRPGRFFAIGQALYRVAFTGQPVAGQNAAVSILLTENAAPAAGTLYYRRAGDAAFTALPFNGSAVIPGTAVTGRGLEYYVDGPGGTYPADAPASRPISQPVFVTSAQAPPPFLPRTYRMISAPFALSDPDLAAVLVDDYGPYSPIQWRLLRWNGAGYDEFPDIDAAFEPGNAFFLITAAGTPFDVESAQSVDTSQPFPIRLEPGWNQIGNPFGFPVAWDRVIRNPAVVNAIAFYDGVEMVQDPAAIGTLDPWEGYFVYNDSAEDVTIQIVPAAPAAESAGKTSPPARLRIVARLPGAGLVDSQNWVGIADASNVPEAPPFGEYVRLSIREDGASYALHYRPPSNAGYDWVLEASSSLPPETLADQSIELSFLPGEGFPADVRLALIDEDAGVARMIDGGAVTLEWGERAVRRFRLVVGSAGYLAESLRDLPEAPVTAALEPGYPNPFHASTTIRYRLDRREAVSLAVYNVLGQVVRTLVDGSQGPGSYEAAWDGRDDAGLPAGNGVYLIRLRAGRFVASRKVTLIR